MSTSVLSASHEHDRDFDVGPPRRPGRKALLWLTLAVVAATGGAAYWLNARDPAADPASEATTPVATGEVTRETLTATESWSGRLGHGTPLPVTSKGEGTITGTAEHDTKVDHGTELYRINEQPVIALIGDVPMYRDLSAGNTGSDVRQLETNLAKLGYDGFDVDDDFTWYTARAVKQWQADVGAEQSGSVDLQDVVFLPRNGRVGGVKVAVGETVAPGTEILGIASSDQIVNLDVDVADRDLVAVGTTVSVRLPGGNEVTGKVTSTAVVEDTSSGDDGGGGDGETPGADDTTTEVEVTLDERVDEAPLGSPVDVVVDVETRQDVLVVPVTALLALAEGGFGIEVVNDDGTHSIVAVEAGMFADGKVEVSSDSIAEGTVVVVASR